MLWALFGIALVFGRVAESRIVGAFVVPHGGSALDPESFAARDPAARENARALHNCAAAAGLDIAALKPDIIYLSSPHGIAHRVDVSLYANDKAEGFAPTDDERVKVSIGPIDLAPDVAASLAQYLGNRGHNVSTITAYSAAEAAPLRWGEVVPLWFARPALAAGAKVVVATQPTRRIDDTAAMVPEMLSLGASLHRALDSLEQRVVVVVSCDLAHTHDPSGPYGYSDAAAPFDDAVARWAREGDRAALVADARAYVNKALSCGYLGLVTLQGAVDEAEHGQWKSAVCAVSHPEYYGMMVATFVRSA
eukprot:m51a1_g4627 hypothetical protein (307) ;mRNA; f:317241-318356